MSIRQSIGAMAVSLAVAAGVTEGANGAIYEVQDFYDDTQALGYAGCDTEPPQFDPDTQRVSAPANAYNVTLVKPQLGDPVEESGSSQPVPMHVTSIIRKGNSFDVHAQVDPGAGCVSGALGARIEYTLRVRATATAPAVMRTWPRAAAFSGTSSPPMSAATWPSDSRATSATTAPL